MSRHANAPPQGTYAFRLVHEGRELRVLCIPLEPPTLAGLTPAQRAIARAIARGASNVEIARVRGTSVHTVANQVVSILRKLGVESRLQIAARLALADVDCRE